MRYSLLCFVAGLVLGCGSIPPPPSPESAQIKVQLSGSRTAVYQRTIAAFVDEGLNIAQGSAEGGVITTVPVDEDNPTTYRAALISTDSATVVVLSGSIENKSGALFAQALTGLQTDALTFPLHSAMTGDLGKLWERLERVAARLRESK